MWKAKNPFPHSHSLHGCGILQRQTKTDVYTKDWTLPKSPSLRVAILPHRPFADLNECVTLFSAADKWGAELTAGSVKELPV